ncbi:MAG: hypothetical protein HQK73_03455 [Desulfamplus sp.]|nr:hypothetical protein [Desulfamplus sp.]
MKITSAETIQSSEKELIDFINAELDWGAIEEMILEKHKLQLQDEVVYKHGDIIVQDNQIAYQLDFDIKVSLSLIFNRQGDCIDIKTPDGRDLAENNLSEELEEDKDADYKNKKYPEESQNNSELQNNWSKMASNIAEMIHEINQDT